VAFFTRFYALFVFFFAILWHLAHLSLTVSSSLLECLPVFLLFVVFFPVFPLVFLKHHSVSPPVEGFLKATWQKIK
jgi:hypothetical protein